MSSMLCGTSEAKRDKCKCGQRTGLSKFRPALKVLLQRSDITAVEYLPCFLWTRTYTMYGDQELLHYNTDTLSHTDLFMNHIVRSLK